MVLHFEKINIDVSLVRQLIITQFSQWANLPIKPVEFGGWDNRTFHLGEQMSIRIPSAEEYALKVEKEQFWLKKLAPSLPLPIPTPLAMGHPSELYPFHWSVYRWIDGETASIERITNLSEFATALGEFLGALQHVDATAGPMAGAHNFYRGGSLMTYDDETRLAIKKLGNKIDAEVAMAIWNRATSSAWQSEPVWVHLEIAPLIEKAKAINFMFRCPKTGELIKFKDIPWMHMLVGNIAPGAKSSSGAHLGYNDMLKKVYNYFTNADGTLSMAHKSATNMNRHSRIKTMFPKSWSPSKCVEKTIEAFRDPSKFLVTVDKYGLYTIKSKTTCGQNMLIRFTIAEGIQSIYPF